VRGEMERRVKFFIFGREGGEGIMLKYVINETTIINVRTIFIFKPSKQNNSKCFKMFQKKKKKNQKLKFKWLRS
jgi:hypothetical protein